jgi:Galactose oxidase-like, Early set domain/Calx-beta domain/Glyoxal oxidase N-terminus
MYRYLIITCALAFVILGVLTFAPRNSALPLRSLYPMQAAAPSMNVAAAVNGGIASASSVHSSGLFPVAAVINGDRKAQNWGNGGGWNDNTQGDYSSDIITVNFPASNFVNQINVFTLRDNFQDNLTAPTLTETFSTCENSGQGITEFEVQYWNGTFWVTVPGGIVGDNNKVWRQFSFPEVSTSAVRVQVHGAVRYTTALNFSRIVEIEAFGRTAGFNIAAAANGSTASATSTFNTNYLPSAVIDGDRTGFNWGRGGFGSGWNDATENTYSVDWVRIDFFSGIQRRINEIDVYTLRDGFATKTNDPDVNETFNTADNTGQGMTDYDVQYLSGVTWKTIPGGKVTANNKVRRQFKFSPILTSAIRVAVNKGGNFTTFANNWSRLVEIEAWDNGTVAEDTVWVEDSLPAGAIPQGSNEGWNWTCFNPIPLSGSLAHTSAIVNNDVHQHFFSGATQTLMVNAGDTLIAHVFLDPANPPSQVMLQWNDGTWEHRAYWGASLIGWGVEGQVSRKNMGPLPPTGQWVRLEVPAADVGLAGRVLNGMAFTLFGGRATWDHGGKFAPEIPGNQTISINDPIVNEGNGGVSAVFNVTLSSASSDTIKVNYKTANGSATAFSDYSPALGTVVFNPGQTSVPISIPVVGDTVSESTENFFVNLSNPVNAVFGDNQGVGTINNDDSTPGISVSISDATVIENSCGGTPKTVFTVALSSAIMQNVFVNYTTSNGTASSGSDYNAASGTLVIPPGKTTGTINILARSDLIIEPDETFFVTLSSPVNAIIGDGSGQAIIKDDDFTPPTPPNAGAAGQWGPCEDLETVPVHINLLPDGRLLYWGRDKHPDTYDTAGSCNTYTWNPVTKVKSGAMPTLATNLFCSTHSFLPDGRLMVAGGHDRDDQTPSQELIGETEINTFNYQNSSWTLSAKRMEQGRWYPSSVMLGDGLISIFSGTYWDGSRTAPPNNKPIIQSNKQANFYGFSGTTEQLTRSGVELDIRNYPYLHLAADGRVFGIAGKNGWFYNKALDQYLGVSLGLKDHFEGSSVLYNTEQQKVMIIGGREDATNGTTLDKTSIFDINTQTFSVGPTLNHKRQYQNTTLLPDGKILASGGQKCDGAGPNFNCPAGAAHIPEIWNPANPTVWTPLAETPMKIPRIYHSVALLLPDARVLIGGGGLPAAGGDVVVDPEYNAIVTCSGNPPNDPVACRHYGHNDVEIFSPPYLFNSNGTLAARPTINSAPASVNLGETFNVSISSGTQVTSAALMKLPSVTHGLNFDQRRVVLTPQFASTTNLTLTIPTSGNICPPGYYMLFVMTSTGVPSISKMVKVTAPSGPTTFPLSDVGSRMTRNLDGRLQVFYKGSDSAVYYFVQTAADASTWTGPLSLGGAGTSNPVAIANADGRLEAFVKGTDNRIYHQWQTAPGGSWSGWVPIGGSAAGDPAVARNTNGKLQLVYRGGDNLLYTFTQTSAGASTWTTTPTNLFGTLIADPAIGVNNDGRLEVFAVMSDNGLSHIWQTTAGGSTWSGWFGLGGFLDPLKPDVARNTDGLLQVFYREFGMAGAGLAYIKQSPGSPGGWSNHTSLGNSLNSAPTVGINGDGRLEVFARVSDNTLHHIWQTTPSGSTWSSWISLGGGLTSGAAPAQNAGGKLSVVVRGLDNALYYNVQSTAGSSTWAGFVRLGGNASSF